MCNYSTQTLCNAWINYHLNWCATMNSFRLTTVKNTMFIYANSFRFCQPYFLVESQHFYLSRIGFVTVQN